MIERGEVALRVGEKTYILSPTLEALLRINRELGSPVDAARALQKLELSAIFSVIAAGARLSSKQMEAVQEEVFAAGIVNIAPQLGPFISALLDPAGTDDPSEGTGEGK
jgi:hypothetical protein